MSAQRHVDAYVHQWSTDLDAMLDHIPPKWQDRVEGKTEVKDVLSGHLFPQIGWYHAFWNEDAPSYDRPDSDDYTGSERYRSPAAVDAYLDEQGTETALLGGHEIQFLPALLEPDYQAAIASAYNRVLADRWVEPYDRFSGHVVVPSKRPDLAAEEIERYADHPGMVSALLFTDDTPLGDRSFRPIYEAAEAAGMPLTVRTSGNTVHRETAVDIPETYATFDANLGQHHMANLISMLFQGVFDDFPDLDVVWAGEGIGWAPQTGWRSTRYYRNFEPEVPRQLDREPHEYLASNCYFTTFSLGSLPDDTMGSYFEFVGPDNVLYASGYPRWNADTPAVLPDLPAADREAVLAGTAERVYAL